MKILIDDKYASQNDWDAIFDPTGKNNNPTINDIYTQIDDNECLLIVDTNLNKYHYSQLEQWLQLYCSKLRSGGELCVSGTNVTELNRLLLLDHITITDYNTLMFSGQPFNQGIYTPSFVVDLLKSYGLTIDQVTMSSIFFTIKAVRGMNV